MCNRHISHQERDSETRCRNTRLYRDQKDESDSTWFPALGSGWHPFPLCLRHCGTIKIPNAVVTINAEGKKLEAKGEGTGPVDAIYSAIDQIIGEVGDLTEFNVNAVTEGIDAVAEVIVKVKSKKGRTFTGKGVHTDIVIASAKAYLQALNKILSRG